MFASTRNAPSCPKLRFKESAFKFAYQQQHITDQLKVAIYSQLLSLSPSSSVCLSISLSLSICPSVPSWLSGNPLRPTTKRALNASCKVLSNTHPHIRIVCALPSVPHTHTHPWETHTSNAKVEPCLCISQELWTVFMAIRRSRTTNPCTAECVEWVSNAFAVC